MGMRTLFLNPPSFEGFDGGAGSRYQARREVRSFWYPTWLAQPAAIVKNSKLVDAPPDDLDVETVLKMASDFELTIIHTSTPSLGNDCKTAGELRQRYPKMKIGFVGAHAAVLPEQTLNASPAIDFVARKEFDYTLNDVAEGKPWETIHGISYRKNGQIIHNPERELIANLDEMPFVVDVYKRDLTIDNYAIGYLQQPYLSLYTGRGCPAQCTFCLWPQTIAGRHYRTRSPESVYQEMKRAKELFPQVKEFFFDDDTFTANLPRTREVAKKLGTLGITWSCNSRANVNYETLKVLKDNGLRLLLVGYESGNEQILSNIKKGVSLEKAREFTKHCHELGIIIHGTFILGLPGETRETIQQTIRYACELDLFSLQVSLAAAYPGTELYNWATENGYLKSDNLVSGSGIQNAVLEYPGLSAREISDSLEKFYKRYYFRPKPMLRIVKTMLQDKEVAKRRLREGAEFFRFLARRKRSAAASA
ncbi:MAG: hopanoid biosynthesis associated radical SAM protein HpnJ [Verrucomicrobiae bacterium]|nr:hopanoid biosynthesis associated radical SAM protein HpnJ [Verrucomicrobiae bacterium]